MSNEPHSSLLFTPAIGFYVMLCSPYILNNIITRHNRSYTSATIYILCTHTLHLPSRLKCIGVYIILYEILPKALANILVLLCKPCNTRLVIYKID